MLPVSHFPHVRNDQDQKTGADPDIKAPARLVPVHTAFEHKFHGRIIE